MIHSAYITPPSVFRNIRLWGRIVHLFWRNQAYTLRTLADGCRGSVSRTVQIPASFLTPLHLYVTYCNATYYHSAFRHFGSFHASPLLPPCSDSYPVSA